jgi:hypothetical protein
MDVHPPGYPASLRHEEQTARSRSRGNRCKFQAVFIDRDGTIGGTEHFINPRDFLPYPFSTKVLQLLKETGVKTFAFTNQHRIRRDEASVADFHEEFMPFGFDEPSSVLIALMTDDYHKSVPLPQVFKVNKVVELKE